MFDISKEIDHFCHLSKLTDGLPGVIFFIHAKIKAISANSPDESNQNCMPPVPWKKR